MIVVLDDDPTTLAQLTAALRAHVRQLRRNGGWPAPDLLLLLRSLEARSGQERPELAHRSTPAHSEAEPADGAGTRRAELIALTYGQAAQRLGISERTVRRRVVSGELPVIRLGGRVCRIPAAALDAIAEQGEAS
ncbi:helix-turn-helix domain-containing protein [Nocardioides sp.]|uniref:helix-turn-helix domain-containing protein n=1 Tax=Nocardioides sp. TaxID=35761 RepID=UPI002601BA32|nr:helix-turn-helix domain-containing protein [Nocardioides sp.]MDI6912203.1 helix-turn-helix domain-containing protein [Nocardioides sp.]